jgi:predicted AAA+ superfamily ATPase
MQRNQYLTSIEQALRVNPVVAMLGPRQCGKTTLARAYSEYPSQNYFDLEDPLDHARLANPKLALEDLSGLVVIDEIQRSPELFPVLRVLVDRPKNQARFLILGSASRDLIRQTSESLAGRISYIEVTPFSLSEVGSAESKILWSRGGFPKSFLAASDMESRRWREDYIRTYLERDLPMLGIQIPASSIRRFWMMLSHYHGQTFNASELARSLQISDTTARRYLDILSGTFMVSALQPWFENIGKRQVKTPKIFFRDSGIFHSLIGVADMNALLVHPKLGASWEGFALEEIKRSFEAREEECFFWAVHQQAELDLLIVRDGRRLGFEIKFSDSPTVTSSMRTALKTLRLDSLLLVCPGSAFFKVDEQISVCGLERIPEIAGSS